MTDHSEIRAALEAATPGPWVVHEDDYDIIVGTAEGDNWPFSCCPVARGMEQGDDGGLADAHLIANAPTWLAELLAENERLREDVRTFSATLGFGDGLTEPAASLAELVDPLAAAMEAAHEHDECPIHCELCGERLAATPCEGCHGSGCLPNAQLAYLECEDCVGAGRVHNGCVEKSYAELAAEIDRLTHERDRWRDAAHSARSLLHDYKRRAEAAEEKVMSPRRQSGWSRAEWRCRECDLLIAHASVKFPSGSAGILPPGLWRRLFEAADVTCPGCSSSLEDPACALVGLP